jgi:small-conductance mechanosensitive channel
MNTSLFARTLVFVALLATLSFAPVPAARAQTAAAAVDAGLAEVAPKKEFPVVVFNRTIVVFRATFLGLAPEERALQTRRNVAELMARRGEGKVSVQPVPEGRIVSLDGVRALILVAEDADQLRGEALDSAAQHAAQALERVIAETREARDPDALLGAASRVGLASIVLLVLWRVAAIARRWLVDRLEAFARSQSEKLKVGGAYLFDREHLFQLARRVVSMSYAVLILALLYEWLGYCLVQFPYTRPWGEGLTRFLVDQLGRMAVAVAHALPDIAVSIVIFFIAYKISGLVEYFFGRIETRQIAFSWLEPETAKPTSRLVCAVLWIFALAMAYPYLPGAQSEAFKTLSVLAGLMVSLGSSSIVAQAGSGLILMYSRALKVGEYVRIAEHEGTVLELGVFATRIRTGLGEELSLPNAVVIGNVTRNYSRAVDGAGYIVDTTVTIGYDTPWRQVEAMLVQAARKTPGIRERPAPRVFQTGLSDFYPAYRLVCQALPGEPRSRADLLSALHANIQDVFNENGVQIMSPHYLGDPAEAKVVAKEKWFAPPAATPGA